MSQHVTVIGGADSTGATTGLVSVPLDVSTSVASALQGLLNTTIGIPSIGGSVASGTVLANVNGITSVTSGTIAGATVYEVTNTDGNGSVSAGSVSGGSFTAPSTASTIIVQAPGTETVLSTSTSNSQLAVLGAQSQVTFNAFTGGGSVVAGGAGDNIGTSGGNWSVFGSTDGGDTINSTAANLSLTTSGAQRNIVGLGATNATVVAGGKDDLISSNPNATANNDVISVTGGANVLITGSNDTVFAAPGATSVNAFFSNAAGGNLDFINSSSIAVSVTGGIGGSVTAQGGAGGGFFQGGGSGSNLLLGGAGTVTLVGGGISTTESVSGGISDQLFAGNGNATLVATAAANGATFTTGAGTDSVVSAAQGVNNFFLGAGLGSATLTGSTTTGATNNYLIAQSSANGGGTDVITDFRAGKDQLVVNFGSIGGGVSISGIQSLQGNTSGSLVSLSNGTTVKLIGVNSSSISITGGGTSIG